MTAGRPGPQGATWTGDGVNFALASMHAEAVELCLFDADGRRETARVALPARTGDTWHGFLPGAGPGLVYGYRVHGRYAPRQGHRFNKHKLLLDPYARALSGELTYDAAVYGYARHGADAWRQDISDSAGCMPKARVVDPRAFDWQGDRRPCHPLEQSVVYELHVKGFTRMHPDVPAHLRGTYLGLAQPAVLDYLLRLGVTAVELMPVQHFVSEPHLRAKGLSNYWGYNTLAFFAPHAGYALADPVREFREMVRALHAAGIEVILDVVFNHTAEGGEDGPTLSLRGIDNLGYYRLEADDLRRNVNWTGCGNTLDFGRPMARRLALDCLRYWATDMRVDGFRFDLATTLGREQEAFNPAGDFFAALQADPVLSRLKLIAEPWDLGPDGYRLGEFPRPWSEWNDRFRDTARAFWRGDAALVPRLAERLAGSSDLFGAAGRGPQHSVNYVACHDGFTLADAVSYAHKHNEANGEDNRDGDGHAVSWNLGVEGPTDDPVIQRERARQRRNLLATLLLSQGIPMLQAGDEFARTQRGNNNAYCQDNELAWLDWRLAPAHAAQVDFVRRLIQLRRENPVFQRRAFLAGVQQHHERFKDVLWLRADGAELGHDDWHDPGLRTFGMLLDGTGLPPAQADARRGDNFLVLFNAGAEAAEFTLPPPISGETWVVTLDTSQEALTVPARGYRSGHVYLLDQGSLALLVDHE
ncbi:glycogen debranching protein GlgX [Thioalkalivibrio sp. XN279]|uniref:glycogen debranching protein GlgX n=1 Tax=Thioalkalivibrio sp. XN279 TaxID=2714953 RepID=UPI00140B78A5|nr:glycogen debranching protein GlgX [Thioalkalivibrio sp. XN279]NHA14471.1 glycogen debranching protein GlgX [Thioalkalivibrio sp. XN279]